jgi:hypothetical protein
VCQGNCRKLHARSWVCFAGSSTEVWGIHGVGVESLEGLVYRTMENNDIFLDLAE